MDDLFTFLLEAEISQPDMTFVVDNSGCQGHSLDLLGPSHRQQDHLLPEVHLHQEWGEEHLQLCPSTAGQGHPHAGTRGRGHPLP